MSISQDQLFINGQETQLAGRIGVNIQGVDLANQDKIREPYTHTINLGSSRRNEEILGHPSDPATAFDTLGAYTKKRANVLIGGATMIQNGKIGLVSSGENIQINIIGEGVDFWGAIGEKSIKSLNWGSDNNFTFTGTIPDFINYPRLETWIKPNYVLSPFQGTHNPYKKNSRDDQLIPFIKKSKIMEQICEDAGYTLDWSFLRLLAIAQDKKGLTLANSYISLQVPPGKGDNYVDLDVDINIWSHDINQSDFMKGILFQYGAFLFVKEKIVYFTLLEEFTNRKNRSANWTGKIDQGSRPDLTYDIGYAQNNWYRYESYNVDQLGHLTAFMKLHNLGGLNASQVESSINAVITSENKNLDNRRDVATIPWSPILTFKIDNDKGSPRQICFLGAWDKNTTSFTELYDPVDLVIPESSTTYRSLAGASEVWTGDGNNLLIAWHGSQEDSAPIHISNSSEEHGLHFTQKLQAFFYSDAATRFIREPLQVQVKMNLSVMDVRQYTETSSFLQDIASLNVGATRIRSVWIEELNGYFHVKRISSYVAGKTCSVQLTRI